MTARRAATSSQEVKNALAVPDRLTALGFP